MQVYLGDYPNSPKNHDKKFRRAVKSFLAMKDKDTSLVIVSDGCQLAHEIYFKEFAKHKNIKYAFVEKTTPKMYEEYKGQELSEYHRVGPRQLGRMIEDSDLVAYLDSDDFLLPDASIQIREFSYYALRITFILFHMWKMTTRFFSRRLFLAESLPGCILEVSYEQIQAVTRREGITGFSRGR